MTRLIFVTLMTLYLAIFSGSLQAQGLDINLSNDSVQINYAKQLSSDQYGRKEAIAGLLYNRSDNIMFDAGLQIVDEAGSKTPGLEAGIGVKLYAGKTKSRQYLNLGLGGLLGFRPLSFNRLIFNISAYYAPSIVSFLDSSGLWELGAQIGYEIVPSASVYVGYRDIHTDIDVRGERTVDKGAFIGVSMNF